MMAIALTAHQSATTTAAVTTTTDGAVVTAAADVAPASTTTTTTTATTTTTTTPPPLIPQYGQSGKASWYPEARDGYCASPYLNFGTVVTVTDEATGHSIRCIVDDRQARNPGRVIDLSYEGFSDLGRPSIGLIEVHLTW